MLNILLLLLAEAFLTALLISPVVGLLYWHISANKKSVTYLFKLFIICFFVFFIINSVGSYFQKSAFIGLFIMVKYIWFIGLFYILVTSIYKKLSNKSTHHIELPND